MGAFYGRTFSIRKGDVLQNVRRNKSKSNDIDIAKLTAYKRLYF